MSNVVEFFGGNRFTAQEREEFKRIAGSAFGWTSWEFDSAEDGTEYVSIWTGGEYAALTLQKAAGALVVTSEHGGVLRKARTVADALAGLYGIREPAA